MSAVAPEFLNKERTAVDVGKLRRLYLDCNLFGDRMIVDQIPPLSERSFRRRLEALPDGAPSSYYLLQKIPLGRTFIYATHVTTLDLNSEAYDADAVARRTAHLRVGDPQPDGLTRLPTEAAGRSQPISHEDRPGSGYLPQV